MTAWRRWQPQAVGPKRGRCRLRALGLLAVYPQPHLSLNPLARIPK
jgi:hypothetical protein